MRKILFNMSQLKKDTLAKNTVIYFIGTFGSKILSFLLLPLYSNYLTQGQYGDYDLINTIIQIATPAVTLMLDNAMYVYLLSAEKNDRKREDLIAYAVKTLMVNSVIAIGICTVVGYFQPIEYMILAAMWLISISFYSVWSSICRGLNQARLYAFVGVVITAIILIGNIVGLLVLHLDYIALMISNIVAQVAAVLIIEIKTHVFKYARKGHPSKVLKKELLRYTVPLLPNQVSWWVINASDRLVLNYTWGAAANGLYAMASKIPSILSIIHNIFSMSWSDVILSAEDIHDIEKDTEKIYNSYIQITVGVSIVLICSNQLIFRYIIRGNFVEGYHYTYFLYVANVFNAMASSLGAYYGYFKKSASVGVSTVVAAIINAGINMLFINKYGIQVAAISTFCSFGAMWLIRLYGLRKLVTIKMHPYTVALLVLLIPFYFADYVEGIALNLILVAFGCIVAVIINHKNIYYITSKGKLMLRSMKHNKFSELDKSNSNAD
ncbi:MAG: oligosaccharide flippase family protein [Clostridiales bacterium]|nr:oligosaccharide flippase family protein [Clostridiales bacterium]